MRLDMIKESKQAKRKGLAIRTTIVSAWFLFSLLIGYLIASIVLNAESIGAEYFYHQLQVPESIGEGIIKISLVVIITALLQFVLVISFALASPEARQKSGQPTAVAQDPDPLDMPFQYRQR